MSTKKHDKLCLLSGIDIVQREAYNAKQIKQAPRAQQGPGDMEDSMKKHMTDEQARSYIAGEAPFDPVEWEREHIIRLCKSGREALERIRKSGTAEHMANLKATVAHWCSCLKDTPSRTEYESLLEVLASIPA